MNFLTINKNYNGSYTIKNTINENKKTYYFCTLAQAIKAHRKENSLTHKHLTKIFL